MAASCLPLCSLTVEQGGRILGAGGALYITAGVRTCKATSECAERIPSIPPLGPGGLARCWVPGREGRGAGWNRLPIQQLTLL